MPPRYATEGSFTEDRMNKAWAQQAQVDADDGRWLSPREASRHLKQHVDTLCKWDERDYCPRLGRAIRTREFPRFAGGQKNCRYYLLDDLDAVLRAMKSGKRQNRPVTQIEIRNDILRSVLAHFNVSEPFNRNSYAMPFSDTYGTWPSVLKSTQEYEEIEEWSLREAIRVCFRTKLKRDALSVADRGAILLGKAVHEITLYGKKCHIRSIPHFSGCRPILIVGCLDADLAKINAARKRPDNALSIEKLVERYTETTRNFWRGVFRYGDPGLKGKRPELLSTWASNGLPCNGIKKKDADKVYAHWQSRKDGRWTDPVTGRVYLRPDVREKEFEWTRANSVHARATRSFRLRHKRHPALLKDGNTRPVDSVRLDNVYWLAEDDLLSVEKWLAVNRNRPKETPRGILLPLPAIVASGMPSPVWEWYAKARRISAEKHCFVVKSGRKLVNRQQRYWPKSEVDAFRERLDPGANTHGPMKSAKQIAETEGITALHDRLGLQGFLAACADQGWILSEKKRLELVNRQITMYDQGRYQQLLDRPTADVAAPNTKAIPNDVDAAPAVSRTRRRGRRPGSFDPDIRRRNDRLLVAWRTGEYKTYSALGNQFEMDKHAVHKALKEAVARERGCRN